MIQAVIFDLDGTVLDNEDEWEAAFAQTAANNNIPKSGAWMQNGWWHEPGIGVVPNWKKFGYDESEAERLAKETRLSYAQIRRDEEVRVHKGIVEAVDKIKELNWQTGLATSSSWSVAEKELEELGLYLAFEVTTTGEEVMLLKPDPEIYMLTAQKLGLEPEECLVVEDAQAGLLAAKTAGCKVVGLVSEYAPVEMWEDQGTDYVIHEMEELVNIVAEIEKSQVKHA